MITDNFKKRLSLTALIVVTLGIAPIVAADAFKVDAVHSTAQFRVKHLGVSMATGRFNKMEGTITLDKSDPAKSAIEITIPTDSIDTANADRDQHLKGEDFFDVAKYPTMTFKSTSVKQKDEKTLEVTGDFTMHGVTKSITITAAHTGTGKDRRGNDLVGFETTFEIKRSEYGMAGMIGPIADEVQIYISLEAGMKPEA